MDKELANWLDYIVTYSMYCKEISKERWLFELENFVMRYKSYDKEFFAVKKECYNIVGEFLKMMHDGQSWENIKEIFNTKVTTPMSISIVGQLMLSYSEHGIEFIEQVVNVSDLDWLCKLQKEYEEKKLVEEMKKIHY